MQLAKVYQTAQKMTVGHLIRTCDKIPQEIRDAIAASKEKSGVGGGIAYWTKGIRELNVIETDRSGLAFQDREEDEEEETGEDEH